MPFVQHLRTILWLCLLGALLTVATQPAAAQGPARLRIAILDDDLPGLDRVLVGRVQKELTSAGATVTRLTADQLADPKAFSRETQDGLVLTDSPSFPGLACANVQRFLEAGEDLILLGGKAYANPVCRAGGRWCDRTAFAKLLEAVPTKTPLLSFDDGDLSAWKRGTNHPEHPSRVVAAPGEKGQCLRLELKGLGQWQWDTYAAPMPSPIPPTDDLLCLYARGPTGTAQVVLEIDETDGSRWVTALDLTREWRRYVIEAAAFHFFKDGSPTTRGGAGDRLHLDHARQISFGLATGISNHPDGDHVIEIDEVGAGTNDLGASLDDFRSPNTVCFDDYEPYVLRDAVRAVGCPGQDVAPNGGTYSGRVDGLSAVGFTLWDRSEMLPLLQAEDSHGRTRGWAASALVHYDGRYKGGCWLMSGITTPEFYNSPAFLTCLKDFVQAVTSRDLPKECADRNAGLNRAALPLTTPPLPPLHRSADGKHFLLPDGRRFFMIGCDYIGALDRKFFGGPTMTWLYWLESDFRRAHDAGLNCMRIYAAAGLYRDPVKLAALKECARKYGIYLLIVVVDGTDAMTREELAARCRVCAEAFKDEPMLLGYDLQNEPYAYKLADIRDGAQTLGERHPLWKRWGEYEQWAGLQMAGNYTSFPGAKGPLPRDAEWGPVLDGSDGIFGDWIGWQVDAIRAVDKTHPISVGYNTSFALLPANRQLDFMAYHAYQSPADFDGVRKDLTTLDRLRLAWPDKPISLGEFGYTNGTKIGGAYLDLHTTALGEFLHWLYAYAHDFEGCTKWALTDHPLELSRQQCTWLSPDDLATHIDQGRYGFFWSDGTIDARPKPLVYALRFLREYVDAGGDRGELQVVPAKTQIGAGYVFHAPGALFVGNVAYQGPAMQFTSEQAANVLLRWDQRSLRIMSTADAAVRVNLRALTPASFTGKLVVSGKLASHKQAGDWLELNLLEGEVVTVAGS